MTFQAIFPVLTFSAGIIIGFLIFHTARRDDTDDRP